MVYGKYTRKLGEKLTEDLKKSKYDVYYAHGDSKLNNNVCHPTPYFGSYSTASTLSFVDVVVVEKENRKVRIFCEIEERGATPKKIIGNLINVIISEKLQIKGIDYEYEKPQFILGIKVNERGNSKQKADTLKNELKSAIKEQYWNRIKIRILCDSENNNLIENVKSEICSILNNEENVSASVKR